MKIICSVTEEQKDYGDCLACAASAQQPPCGYTYALLRAMYAGSQQSERANEIHVTDLTGCVRKRLP